MKKVYWTMKDGNKIDIDRMSIEHLRNTLKMIVRQSLNYSNLSFTEEEIKKITNKSKYQFENEENIWKD